MADDTQQSSIMRDRILAADDIATEQVSVPEWNVTVEVRGMSAADRNRIVQEAMEHSVDGDTPNLSVMFPDLVIASTYDPDTGLKVFNDDDRDALNAKAAKPIDLIAKTVMRLSGMSDEATEGAKKSVPEKSD